MLFFIEKSGIEERNVSLSLFRYVVGEVNFQMPNKKSAEKRVRIAERNRVHNRFWSTRCKNAVKKVLEAVTSKDNELMTKTFDIAQSVIDKAVVKGVMHRNTAARRKKMMAKRIKAICVPSVA